MNESAFFQEGEDYIKAYAAIKDDMSCPTDCCVVNAVQRDTF